MNCRYHISNDPTCSESLDKSMIYKRYFPRELNITLEFISTSDSPIKNGDRRWELNLKNKISPPINSVTLNESKPLYIVDILGINEFDIISVCSPETDVLELFIASDKTSLQNYVLYDGSDYFGKLDSPEIFDENSQNFGRISSNTGCFEIQKTAEDLIHETGIFLFRMKNAQSKNCMNEKNIKILSSENTIFKSTANSEGDCEVIILSPKSPLFQFSIDFMTGTPNNIFTFKSPMNQNIFAEINSMEMSLWKNLRLYTPALSIILPPSTFFNISARFGSDGIIKAEMDSQKGIMASPSYSDPNFLGSSGYSEPLFSIMSSNSTSVFTAELELQSKEGDNKVLIKVDFDSNDYYLQYPGEKLTVTGTRIHVEQYSANDKFLISYTLNPSQSSSTILTTTFNPSNPPSTVNPTNPPSTNPSITTSNPNTSTTTSETINLNCIVFCILK
uniref:CUB-like domain-containing protein n=1 Tax=Panagrolaimus sp. PS1159 TaxID=55785 RepID=A0AC35FWC2_9BILA